MSDRNADRVEMGCGTAAALVMLISPALIVWSGVTWLRDATWRTQPTLVDVFGTPSRPFAWKGVDVLFQKFIHMPLSGSLLLIGMAIWLGGQFIAHEIRFAPPHAPRPPRRRLTSREKWWLAAKLFICLLAPTAFVFVAAARQDSSVWSGDGLIGALGLAWMSFLAITAIEVLYGGIKRFINVLRS